MRVRLLCDGGREPVIIKDATLMIVETETGDPVSIACEYGFPGAICVAHVKDDDFNTVLKNLGIDRVVVATDIKDVLRPPERLPVILPETSRRL